jgi:predicted NAD/FAD-binding protein
MKIAVIGAGISGLVCSYYLTRYHDLTLFEARDYPGGHTRTVEVSAGGRKYAVDTGFIVYNDRNYPRFTKILDILGVKARPTVMGFSVRCEKTGLEYSGGSAAAFFAQRRNFFRPAFHRLILEIFRFSRNTARLAAAAPGETLGGYLKRKAYSDLFIHKFIIPMGAALWSADPAKIRDFPAHYFARFFDHHALLKVRNKPRWYVIDGGSRQYVLKMIEGFKDRIRLETPVSAVRRFEDRVEIVTPSKGTERFDEVVIAAHSDQALAMLSDPSPEEAGILGALPYQENRAVLHTDHTVLPRRRAAWASWNYFIPENRETRATLTYNMNILQSLSADRTFCVTLNDPRPLEASKTIDTTAFHHPVHTAEGLRARREKNRISGVRRTHYCGAYWGYGFHEDGVESALNVCRHFGIEG